MKSAAEKTCISAVYIVFSLAVSLQAVLVYAFSSGPEQQVWSYYYYMCLALAVYGPTASCLLGLAYVPQLLKIRDYYKGASHLLNTKGIKKTDGPAALNMRGLALQAMVFSAVALSLGLRSPFKESGVIAIDNFLYAAVQGSLWWKARKVQRMELKDAQDHVSSLWFLAW